MRRFFRLSFIVLALAPPVMGQNEGQEVVFDRNVPALVRSYLPKNSQTLFYGRTSIDGREYAIHIYRAFSSKVAYRTYNDLPSDVTVRYSANIFGRIPAKSRNSKGVFKKLGSATSLRIRDPIDRVKVTRHWLDPQSKRIPILRLNCIWDDGFTGPNGNWTLLVFNEGLTSKPLIAIYRYYADFYTSEDASFEKFDERGYMVVTVSRGAPGVQPELTYYYWNGSGFTTRS